MLKSQVEVLIYFPFPWRNMILLVVLHHQKHYITTSSPSLDEHDIINSLSPLSSQKKRKIFWFFARIILCFWSKQDCATTNPSSSMNFLNKHDYATTNLWSPMNLSSTHVILVLLLDCEYIFQTNMILLPLILKTPINLLNKLEDPW